MRLVVFVLVVAACLTAAVAALLVTAYSIASHAEQPKLTVPPKHLQQRLLELNHEAIETAYRQQVYSLFLNWMKDPTGQPDRARLGVERANRAYIQSMEGIEQSRRHWQETR